jgi:hypothetical protein
MKKTIFSVEAKNGDLERGFVQLVAELVAFDQWEEKDVPQIWCRFYRQYLAVWQIRTVG